MINYEAPATADASQGTGNYGLRTWVRGHAVKLDSRSLRMALIRFPLLTFGVIVRIHWQAIRLWLNKVTFFSKPRPPLKETTS